MKVEIWSDTRCPFCFIGKKRFEAGLQEFAHKNQIEIEWRSFQLDPNLQTDLEKNSFEFLSEIKNIPMPQVLKMHENLAQQGEDVGIRFNFEDAKVANSFKSQMLLQFAKTKGKANEMEEALFEANFEKGENVDDDSVLIEIGKKLGFTETETSEAIHSAEYARKVNDDIATANSIGIQGVPFFIFNDKYAVSGAQPAHLFTEVLEKSWEDFSASKPSIEILNEGDACDIDGNCN